MPTLEDLLIHNRVLSQVQLAVAKRDAELQGKRLAPTLVELGLIDEERLARWTAETSGLGLIEHVPDDAAADLAPRVPPQIAHKHGVVATAIDGDELTVATADPFDRTALEQLHITTGMKIRPVVARTGELNRAIERLYPFDFGSQTLLAEHARPLTIPEEDSLGSSTHIFTPRPATEPESQLDRIEAQLAALTSLVETLERKVASIDATLTRLLPR